ncbi:phosphoribosyltransferase, partial [Yersinia sp. Marseille-Q3913]|uniref:phosphoribosyltransferase n=1 Tax=Yersinia sp. Marseille-Q3913 TaxID=2830769 RepID=UPI00201237C0
VGFTVDVANRLVTVDHSHNNYSVTTPAGNPTVLTLSNGLKVTSIFSRTKGKKGKRGVKDPPGDNSPMLYALKGMHQLQTTRRAVMDLPVYVAAGFQWDWLLPLPSSSNLTALFANRVCSRSGVGVCHHGAMVKISAQQVLKNLEALQIKATDRSAIREAVNRFIKYNSPQTAFQIKAISRTSLRPYINPLMWGHLPAVVPPRRVLLIDDMVTTGTSLVCASDILRHRYPTVQIEALTLFGSTK